MTNSRNLHEKIQKSNRLSFDAGLVEHGTTRSLIQFYMHDNPCYKPYIMR